MSREKQITGIDGTKSTLHSCSTFMLGDEDNLFIGHNLDDNVKVPGLIVVNKRDRGLTPFFGPRNGQKK